MRSVTFTLFVAVFFAIPTFADSIKVGGVLHKDVYIVVKPQYYLVHFPDDGRVEKVSRVRRDVEVPIIDSNESSRLALRKRFEERNAEIRGQSDKVASAAVELYAEAYLEKEALIEQVTFETQFVHWRSLSDKQQETLLREVLNLSASKAAKWAGEQSTVQSRLKELDAARETRQAELSEAEQKRDSDVAWERLYTNPDPYLHQYQREVVEYQAGISDHVDESWLRRANTEAELEARRVAAVNQAHAGEVSQKAAALSEVERSIREHERDALAVENKGKDAKRRYGAFLGRIDALILASRGRFQPRLNFTTVNTWEGDGNKRTATVSIESSVWVLNCTRDDFGQRGDFSVTVYDAESDAPFTRIADKDFLGMRSRVFERPGKYYFVVEQDGNKIPYELTVSTVAGE